MGKDRHKNTHIADVLDTSTGHRLDIILYIIMH